MIVKFIFTEVEAVLQIAPLTFVVHVFYLGRLVSRFLPLQHLLVAGLPNLPHQLLPFLRLPIFPLLLFFCFVLYCEQLVILD